MDEAETKDLQLRQYMVLVRIRGSVIELNKTVDGCFELLSKGLDEGRLITDRMFDMMLVHSNDIGELIKEYLASKAVIV